MKKIIVLALATIGLGSENLFVLAGILVIALILTLQIIKEDEA